MYSVLQNYGAFYDTKRTGLVGGAVELIGNGNVNASMNLTKSQWSYKVFTAQHMQIIN